MTRRIPLTKSEVTMVDHATITGRLYALSEDRGGDVKARIWPRNGQGYIACTADAANGPKLGSYFQQAVRAQGRGQWTRSVNGEWTCQNLHITKIDPVKDVSLRAAIDALRSIDVTWPDDL